MGTKKTKSTSKPSKAVSKTNQANVSQSSITEAYYRQQRWMKWAAIIIFILLLLLLLLAGYATDWLRGTRKDALLDSGNGATSQTTGTGAQGANGTSGGGTSTERTTTSGGTSTTSNTTKETSTNTTTNNSSQSPTIPPELLDLFGNVNPGDNINDVINRANQLGVDVNCHNELLVVQECDFTADGVTVSTKNLLSNDTITSITDNF